MRAVTAEQPFVSTRRHQGSHLFFQAAPTLPVVTNSRFAILKSVICTCAQILLVLRLNQSLQTNYIKENENTCKRLAWICPKAKGEKAEPKAD